MDRGGPCAAAISRSVLTLEGLPPKRRPYYAIHLKEGSTIPNLKSYRNHLA